MGVRIFGQNFLLSCLSAFKGASDKQITATYTVSATGSSLPPQLI